MTDDEDPETKAARWREVDPFPEVPCALLNNADIREYVDVTGMIYPFRSDSSKLKAAAYEADLLGDVLYWDEEGNKIEGTVGTGPTEQGTLVLRPNSITLVQVEPYFRLPYYIALRFNLKIRYVHRGLLLGTGPLVDPGYVGKLTIPLHNLTSDSYTLRASDGLIWIEFTKLNWPPLHGVPGQLSSDTRRRTISFRYKAPTPMERKLSAPLDLIRRVTDGPVRSSIPVAIAEATGIATSAEKSAKFVRNIGLGAAIVLLATLAGVITSLFTFYNQTIDVVNGLSQSISVELPQLRAKVEQLERELAVRTDQTTAETAAAPVSASPSRAPENLGIPTPVPEQLSPERSKPSPGAPTHGLQDKPEHPDNPTQSSNKPRADEAASSTTAAPSKQIPASEEARGAN